MFTPAARVCRHRAAGRILVLGYFQTTQPYAGRRIGHDHHIPIRNGDPR